MPSSRPLPARRIETRQTFLPASAFASRPHQRRLDLAVLQRQVAGDLVADQQRHLAHQPAELGGRVSLAHERELVLNQRVVDDHELRHPAAPCWPLTHASQPGRGWQRGGRLPVRGNPGLLAASGRSWRRDQLRTRVKVCCITNEEDLQQAVGLGADALGFVGPMPSGTGIVDLATARRLIAAVPPAGLPPSSSPPLRIRTAWSTRRHGQVPRCFRSSIGCRSRPTPGCAKLCRPCAWSRWSMSRAKRRWPRRRRLPGTWMPSCWTAARARARWPCWAAPVASTTGPSAGGSWRRSASP